MWETLLSVFLVIKLLGYLVGALSILFIVGLFALIIFSS